MRLRKPCPHGRYDKHRYREVGDDGERQYSNDCPGGEFLPKDALADALKEWDEIGREHPLDADFYTAGAVFILNVLTDQVGESR